MRCTIWYHLYNLKNVKNTHGGVLILVKLQALSVQRITYRSTSKTADNTLPKTKTIKITYMQAPTTATRYKKYSL